MPSWRKTCVFLAGHYVAASCRFSKHGVLDAEQSDAEGVQFDDRPADAAESAPGRDRHPGLTGAQAHNRTEEDRTWQPPGTG